MMCNKKEITTKEARTATKKQKKVCAPLEGLVGRTQKRSSIQVLTTLDAA